MSLANIETRPRQTPTTVIDDEVFDYVENLQFDTDSIIRHSAQRLSDEQIVDTTIVASAEHRYNHDLNRLILGTHYRGYIELYIPNILSVGSRRNRYNPTWMTSLPHWDNLTASEKCSNVLAHELEHRFEDPHRIGLDWESLELIENAERKATAITMGAMAAVGSAVTASFELFHIGFRPSTVGLAALALTGAAYGTYRTEPVIRRRSYYNLPHEVRANQAALDNTNQFVIVQERIK